MEPPPGWPAGAPGRGDTRQDGSSRPAGRGPTGTRRDGSSRGGPLDSLRRLAVQVGRFQVFEELARGGAGAVFRALDTVSGRAVALKLQMTDSLRQRARLLREAEVLTRIDHPHVVRAIAVGELHGHVWLAMELVEGETLEARVRAQGTFPPRLAAELTRKLALGLEHVHERQVLHRDIKPSNVLLDARGEPRLVDFGLALDLDAHSRLSVEGAILGTPGFWAPELAAGQLARVGPASDVYGLGATLYWCLTGAAPLGGASMAEIVHATLRADPDPPSRKNPLVTPELDALVLRCLAKDPAARWGSARELGQALARWLAVGSEVRPSRAAPRRDLRPVVAILLVVLGGASAWGVVWLRTAQPAPPVAPEGPLAPPADRPRPEPPPVPVPPGSRVEPPRSVPSEARRQAEPFHQEGRRLIEEGQYREAVGSLQRALELDPTLADAHVSLGLCRAELGDPRAAEQEFLACLRIDPRHPKALTNLGVMHRRRGDEEGALAFYAQAIDADPRYAPAWANRGWLRLSRLELDQARGDLDRALELDPTHAGARTSRSKVRLLQGDPQGALEDAAAGLGQAQGSAELWECQGESLLRLGQTDQAARSIERGLSLSPASPRGLSLRGQVQEQRGELAAAGESYGRSLELSEDAELRVRRGWVRRRLGAFAEALEDFERALALEPGRVDALLGRGDAKEQMGDPAGALRDLEQALPGLSGQPQAAASVQEAIARLRATVR